MFSWNGSVEKAIVVEKEVDKFIKYRWLNNPKDEFFLNSELKNLK